MITIALIALSWLSAPVAPAQAANDFVVNVMLRIPSASGRGFSIAGSERADEVIARFTTDANLCTSGAGDFALSRAHDYSWEVTARVVSRAAATATVDVTWKQLEGPGAGGPQRSQTLVLKNEERVVLETIRPPGTPRCATEATLEVEAGRPDFRTPLSVGAGARTGGGGGTGAGVSAGARASGGGGGVGTGASANTREFALRDPGGVPATLPPGAAFNVEIWVIRTLPNGTERVEAHDRAQNVTAVSKKFGPVTVATSNGSANVTVGVDLRTFARDKDPLAILINREETFTGTSKMVHGGTSRVSDIPGETEVVSLVLNQSTSYPDQFSVRLKFTKPSEAGGGR